MNKNILYSLLSFLLLIGVSCDNDDSNSGGVEDDYDHESQIPIDQAKLFAYFEEHYITADGELFAIGDGELPDGEILLSDDLNLDSITGIQANGTVSDYKMYYYITEEGKDETIIEGVSVPNNVGFSSASPIDSVFVTYTGMLLDDTVFDSKTDYPIWFQLSSVVQGWARGFPKFKRGSFTTLADDDFEFKDQGKGFLFFPSGLGYKNFTQSSIPSNSPLVFEIELNDVNLIDTDLDNVPSKFELTIDAAGNIETYDTDGDGYEDYRDKDDDNDKNLTIDEVADEYPTFDARGNIEFDYDVTGTKIVAKGTTEGVPNYKNGSIK